MFYSFILNVKIIYTTHKNNIFVTQNSAYIPNTNSGSGHHPTTNNHNHNQYPPTNNHHILQDPKHNSKQTK